jgi:hypothetical protein
MAEVNYISEVRPGEIDGPLCEICGAMMVPHENCWCKSFFPWECLSCGNLLRKDSQQKATP